MEVMAREKKVIIELNDAYKKIYRLRRTGEDGLTVETSIPPEVIEKEARKRGLTKKEFVTRFNAQWTYNSFEGMHLAFVEKED